MSIAREVFTHPDFNCRFQSSVQHCSYIADTATFPYGNKPTQWLRSRVCQVVEACLEEITLANQAGNHTPNTSRHQVSIPPIDMLVVACNTASTIALDALRARYAFPIIGVVPAIKPAATASQSKSVGILATPATIQRDYTAQLIENYAPDCTVALWGSEVLVHQAELQLLGQATDQRAIEQELLNLMAQQPDIDTIVLACTHFPLLKPFFEAILPKMQWVDSGEAIARRVVQVSNESKPLQKTPASNMSQVNPLLPPDTYFRLFTTGGDKSRVYAPYCSRLAQHVATFKSAQHFTITIQ